MPEKVNRERVPSDAREGDFEPDETTKGDYPAEAEVPLQQTETSSEALAPTAKVEAIGGVSTAGTQESATKTADSLVAADDTKAVLSGGMATGIGSDEMGALEEALRRAQAADIEHPEA